MSSPSSFFSSLCTLNMLSCSGISLWSLRVTHPGCVPFSSTPSSLTKEQKRSWLCVNKNCWPLQQNNWLTAGRCSDTQTCHTLDTNLYWNNKNRAQGFKTFAEMFYREDITDAVFANSNEMSVDMSVQIHVLFSVGVSQRYMCLHLVQGLGTITE